MCPKFEAMLTSSGVAKPHELLEYCFHTKQFADVIRNNKPDFFQD